MEDPFSVIDHECEYSSSQEERFGYIRFCGDSEDVPDVPSGDESTQREGISVDPTGIMICSLPETPNNHSDEFLTPRENLVVSSQEKTMNLAVRGADDRYGKVKTSDISTEQFATVDLGENNDPRFSTEKSPSKKGKEVLGFSRESSSGRKRITGDTLGGIGSPGCEVRADNVAGESGESALGKNLALLKNLGLLTASLQSGGVGAGTPIDEAFAGTESKNDASKVVSPSKTTDKDPEFSVHRNNEAKKISQGRSPSENASKHVNERRELPASIRGLVQNSAKRMIPPGTPSLENQSFESLMDAMARLCGEQNATTESGNVDILQTVEQRGLTFPRPRWWQQERF